MADPGIASQNANKFRARVQYPCRARHQVIDAGQPLATVRQALAAGLDALLQEARGG